MKGQTHFQLTFYSVKSVPVIPSIAYYKPVLLEGEEYYYRRWLEK